MYCTAILENVFIKANYIIQHFYHDPNNKEANRRIFIWSVELKNQNIKNKRLPQNSQRKNGKILVFVFSMDKKYFVRIMWNINAVL